MEWSVFFPRDSRRKRERSVRAFLAALNEGRFEEAASLVTGDVIVSDAGGSTIAGQAELIERERKYRKAYGNPQLHVSQLSDNGGEVLIRGQVDSKYEDVAGPTLWRVLFRDGLICRIEIMREGGLMTLPRFQPMDHKLSGMSQRPI